MPVTIYTEPEPPEDRPCPPLPLNGPILVQVIFPPPSHLSDGFSATDTVSSSGNRIPDISPDLGLPCSQRNSLHPQKSLPILSKRLLWFLMLLGTLFFRSHLVKLGSLQGAHSTGALSTHMNAMGFCVPGQVSGASESCPLPQLSPLVGAGGRGFLCAKHMSELCQTTGARRGSVDILVRGWMHTFSSLDAKRVYECLTSTRRGLAARLRAFGPIVMDRLRAFSPFVLDRLPAFGPIVMDRLWANTKVKHPMGSLAAHLNHIRLQGGLAAYTYITYSTRRFTLCLNFIKQIGYQIDVECNMHCRNPCWYADALNLD
ncbi:hypothetical protein C8R43DRAFT_1043208 [Mycena crocata]|nr:hypothetical protein C8R43DRAFT_1043208 [Mycena crocata]